MMRVTERGVALLEVLVAMAVLALGAITAVAVQVRGAQVFEHALRESLALDLAQSMLERVRAAGRLSDGDEALWQAMVTEALGDAATARFSPADGLVQLEVHWPGANAVFSLQGRVLP